ncbi:MAG: dTDP-4-dehydrorhamnose reductase [Nitrospiraceae bacterium]|nr:dTDP-4-dehydrorhamnose reductase [Nitrospiraceae bacterium]
MRIAVTGSEGMLGCDILRVFSDVEIVGLTYESLDITDLDATVRRVREVRPDYVINAAAFTDVDRCESEPDLACRVNGLGARNIAIACDETGCPVVQISTDYVFDGSKSGPYHEWDETNPVNQYGFSKLMGERFVMSHTNRYYIVRTSWLYGKNGKNFVDTIGRLLSERDGLDVVHDQIGSPTYTVDLAKKLKEIIGRGYGVYHVTNSGTCSWYEFAAAIARRKGIGKRITPVTSEMFTRPAKRPANSVLAHTMLRLEGLDDTRHWEEALGEYLA